MKQPEVSATETALTGHTRRHLVPLQFIGPLSSSLASQTSLSGTQFSAELVAVTAHFPWSALTDSPCPGCFRPNETAYSRLGSASDVGMAPGGRRPLDWSIPVFLFDEHASWALDHVAPGDILRLINVRCCQRSRSQSYCSHASLSQPFGCPLPLRVQLVLHGNGQAYGRRGVIVCTGAQLNSHLAAGCSSNPLNFKTLVSHRSNNVTSDTLKRDSTKKISAESMPIAGTCSTTVVKSGAAGSAPTTRISSSRLGVAPAIQSSVHARHASLGVCEGCILLRSVNAYGLLDRLLEGTRERRRIARPLSIRSGDVFRQPIMPVSR
ncbi:unnamed protein product [Protopolystoma xenopodis]|uniref:Protection of telomeres protein 1 ssDNA-binding domain-containing protein n=1 Tax=Protopolystoma xenopodis TaxID=117903 RepID=A0A3S4ZIP1_9PLAT|nr:unnamed protein product [Protopolystoma xenopodis]